MELEIDKVVERLSPERGPQPGCPVSAVRARLKACGLRPTRQRVLLGWLLFGKGDRHVTAEDLFHQAHQARAALSLATVYNTLHQFSAAGLIRQINLGAGRAYFDTNTGEHHHFVVEGEEMVFDVPRGEVSVGRVPEPPPGYAIAGVDVVVRLVRLPQGQGS